MPLPDHGHDVDAAVEAATKALHDRHGEELSGKQCREIVTLVAAFVAPAIQFRLISNVADQLPADYEPIADALRDAATTVIETTATSKNEEENPS